jgi:hypothetical protein
MEQLAQIPLPEFISVGFVSCSRNADSYVDSFSTLGESRTSPSLARVLTPAYKRSGALCLRLFEHVFGFGIEQGNLIQLELGVHLFAQMEDMVALNTGDYAT